jgi:NAD-dependent deacetylase
LNASRGAPVVKIADGLIEKLRRAQSVVVLTGAGVSAESGVPTFRDAQTGLWVNFKPEELATPRAFERNPRLVWEWYEWRRKLVSHAQPNPAHLALAAWEQCVPRFTLVTQNVDGLHQRAGSRDVIELHGNIVRTKCSVEHRVIAMWPQTNEVPPRCPHCGAWLRPDVVWFGEAMPEAETARAFHRSDECEVFLSIGTSAVVHPAAALPRQAKQHSAMLVEINPQPTPLTPHADFVLRGPAGEIVPALVAALAG